MKKIFLFILLVLKLSGSSFDGTDTQIQDIELSDSEKLIFKNQKNIRLNQKNIMKLKLQISSIKESVEGLKSIVESTNDKISQTTKKTNSPVSSDELEKLKKRVDKLEEDNEKRFKKIEDSIEKIIKLLSAQTSINKKAEKKQVTLKDKKIKKLSSKASYKKAELLFKQKRYAKALDYYFAAAKKKYNLATTYFKIAESFYYQKKYEEAIVYYKKSVNIKDDPKYLAKLLLHTGISFKNIGDKRGAKKFLEAVTGGFPKTTEAKIATKILKKL